MAYASPLDAFDAIANILDHIVQTVAPAAGAAWQVAQLKANLADMRAAVVTPPAPALVPAPMTPVEPAPPPAPEPAPEPANQEPAA